MTLLSCSRDLNWIGCIDFGTAYSKFAMVRAVDREDLTREDIQALPISVSPDYRGRNEWLLPSVLFITDDHVLFGEEAERAAIRARGSVREPFSSPKQYLSTHDLAQYDAPLVKEIDPTGKFTARKLLRLFIAHILERAGAHAASRGLAWPVPLRLARPAWDKERAAAGEKLLRDLVINGFAIVDLIGAALSKGGGAPLKVALDSLAKAEEITQVAKQSNAISDNMFIAAQYGRVSVLEATAVAANATRKRGRRLVVVADIGGGTSDFGSFMTPVKGKKTIAEVKGSSQILREAGDFLDMQLLQMLLARAGYVSWHPAARGVSRTLMANGRSNKELLFNNGAITVEVNEKLVKVTLDEFLADPNVKEFVERLRTKFNQSLLKAKECAQENRSRQGLEPPIEVMITGGGHTLPMVQDFLKNPGLPGNYTPASPELLEEDQAFPFDGVRRQLAVAIGGAMKDLPTTRTVDVASAQAPAKAKV
jgi:molecular chaperone DnaK (HSP70)